MREQTAHVPDRWDPEPRWPALIAILAVGGLYLALPATLTVGPRWLFPGIVIALLIPTVISHRAGKHNLNKLFGFTVTGVVTAAMIASVALLIKALPSHKESSIELLVSAASLWFTNILVFELWYWRLDAGGWSKATFRKIKHESIIFVQAQTRINRTGLRVKDVDFEYRQITLRDDKVKRELQARCLRSSQQGEPPGPQSARGVREQQSDVRGQSAE